MIQSGNISWVHRVWLVKELKLIPPCCLLNSFRPHFKCFQNPEGLIENFKLTNDNNTKTFERLNLLSLL